MADEAIQLNSKKVLVALSGGIACYKVATLVSRLVQRGADVRVIMTEAATRFITPLTLQSLSGHPVLTSMWDHDDRPDSQHVGLARWCDILVITPCSADMIAKLAHGLTPDIVSLTASALPRETPLLLAPAMNADMWQNPVCQHNLASLRKLLPNLHEVGPDEGWQACRTKGGGRMSEPEAIRDALVTILGGSDLTPSRQDAKTPSQSTDKLESIIAALGDRTHAVSFPDAQNTLPSNPGFYAMHLEADRNLPAEFAEEYKKNECGLFYLGKTQRSLSQRVAEEHRIHSSPSTFFRSVGAILGYSPQPGSLRKDAPNNNYKFSTSDTTAITKWLDQSISVTYVELAAKDLSDFETSLITRFRPLLNQTHNPAKSLLVKKARKVCIEQAKSQS